MSLKVSTTGSTNKLIFTSDGKLSLNYGEEPKPYERLFGMTEKKYITNLV